MQNEDQNLETEYISNNPYLDCITSLTIPPSNRTPNHILQMKPYFQTLPSFMVHFISEPKHFQSTYLNDLCKSFSYQKFSPNNFILHYGERGNTFYIILSGKIAILTLQNKECYLNEEEYLHHLLNLRRNNEIELLKSTITLNNDNFYIDEDNFDEYVYELSHKKIYSKQLMTEVIETKTYIRNTRLQKDNNNNTNINNTTPITPETFMQTVNIQNTSLENEGNRKLLTIPMYTHVNTFSKGQVFGYFALENKTKKRTATLISLDNVELACLDKAKYETLFKPIFDKSRHLFQDLIYSFSIFRSIPRSVFENHYYNFFKYIPKERNCIIIKENESINKVFVLKSGEFALSTYKSIYELNELIILYKNYIGIPATFEEKQNEDFMISKKFNSELYRHFIFDKQHVNVTIIENSDVLGLDDMIIGNDNNVSHFTVKCISSKCELFNIDKNNYNMLYTKEREVDMNQRNYLCQKMLFYIERIKIYKKRMFSVLEQQDKKNKVNVVHKTSLTANVTPNHKERKCYFPKIVIKNKNIIANNNNNNNDKGRKYMIKFNKRKEMNVKMQKVELYNISKSTGVTGKLLKDSIPDEHKPKHSRASHRELNTLSTLKSTIMTEDVAVKHYRNKAKTLGLNLYNTMFQSCVNCDNDNKRSTVNHFITQTSYARSPNKKKKTLFGRQTNINFVDCLIMDKFNNYYNKTITSLSQHI